jgi:hypothetical protein
VAEIIEEATRPPTSSRSSTPKPGCVGSIPASLLVARYFFLGIALNENDLPMLLA